MVANMGYFLINKQKYYPQGLAKKVDQSTQDLYKECKTHKKKGKKKYVETLESIDGFISDFFEIFQKYKKFSAFLPIYREISRYYCCCILPLCATFYLATYYPYLATDCLLPAPLHISLFARFAPSNFFEIVTLLLGGFKP